MRALGKLTAMAAALVVFITAGSRTASAAGTEPVVLEIHSTFPRGMASLSASETHFASTLARLSQGRMRAVFRHSGEVVPGAEVLSAVRGGVVAAGWGWVGYWQADVPLAEAFAALPFGLDADAMAGWMWEGGGMARLDRAFVPLGVRAIPCQLVAAEAGGWFRKEITAPDDLRGLRIRIAGLGAAVMRELGAEPVDLMVEDIYPALAEGRIDAVEFSTPSADRSFGFEAFASHYYFPGWHQPASWNLLLIGRALWARLDEAQRLLVEDACRLNTYWTLVRQDAEQMAAVRAYRDLGVEIRRFPAPVLDALAAATATVLARRAAADPLFAELLADLRAYGAIHDGWRDLQSLPRATGDHGR